MKNLSLTGKLIAGFSCIALIIVFGGLFGWYGIYQAENSIKYMNDVSMPAVRALEMVNQAMAEIDGSEGTLLVAEIYSDEKAKNAEFKDIEDAWKKIESNLKIFDQLPKSRETAAVWDKVKPVFDQWKKDSDQFYELIKSDKRVEALALYKDKLKASYNNADKLLEQVIEANAKDTNETGETARRITNIIQIFAFTGTIFGIILALALGFLFARMISKPINMIISGLSEGAEQVATASTQVSGTSQHLAEGASQQAASLEETSSSLEELSSMTKQNAQNAEQARGMTGETQRIVDKVSHNMQNMAKAIDEVTKSSEETSKIIKTIDEIAFQTNLLALNAAVEAARAGEAGAGFAVVAGEVRNLSMRAAEAAKNTSGLIENTIKAVKNGSELTRMTQEAISENVENSRKMGSLIDEIAAASQEQAKGIDQIAITITQMDKVTQQTAANAEESASASEEMNAQAEQLKGFVDHLTSLISGGGHTAGAKHVHSVARAEKPVNKMPNKKLTLAVKAPHPVKQSSSGSQKKLRPEQVIPMDDDFKDF